MSVNSPSSSRRSDSSYNSEITTSEVTLSRFPLPLRQRSGLHSTLAQRLPHGLGNCCCAPGVAMDTDSVEVACHRQPQCLLRGQGGGQDRAGLVTRRETSIGQQLSVG